MKKIFDDKETEQYKEPKLKKYNFVSDFYIGEMGEYFTQLFMRFPEPLPSVVSRKFLKNINSLDDEAVYLGQLAYNYDNKVDTTLVRDEFMREYQLYNGDKALEIISNITSIPSHTLGWCIEHLEDFKTTWKNCNPEVKEYSPLFPIVMDGVVISPININKTVQFSENLVNNPFAQGTEVAFTQVWELIRLAIGEAKDVSIEHFSDTFKELIEKISCVTNIIESFLSNVKGELMQLKRNGIEFLKITNAFYCGINNGLINLLQCMLYILQALFQPAIALSYDQYIDRKCLLGNAEDILDWVIINIPKILNFFQNLLSSSLSISYSDFIGIFDNMKKYWDNISRYTVAFYIGITFFEFIINILLSTFTEKRGDIIKETISIQKATDLLKVITRDTISVVTFEILDLKDLLSRLIVKFGKACDEGFKEFIRFIEEFLQVVMNSSKVDDLLR